MKQSPKQPAEKRQAQLIKAAHKIFEKKGYASATTAEIAKAAKLTKGALYFHFKNKEDVFFAVVKERHLETTGIFERLLEEETDPIVFTKKTIMAAFDLIEKKEYFSIDLWQRAFKISKVRNFLAEQHENIESKIIKYLVEKTNLKKKECQSFIRLLHAMIDGVMIRQSICCGEEDLKALRNQIIELSTLYLMKNKIQSG